MPATAGRVRMPANNRMQTSASLNTHGIWQNAIGYDPYAGDADKEKAASSGQAQADGQNAYENMKDLFALARQQGRLAADDTRGGWKGQGQLKGGWAGGKDLGEVAPDPKGGAEDEMPSSTSSWSDSAEVAQFRLPIATKKRSADVFAPSGAAVADGRGSPRDDGGRSSKKRRREKHHTQKEKKSRKSSKKHKKEKSKKEKSKKEKKHKREKRSRRDDSGSASDGSAS